MKRILFLIIFLAFGVITFGQKITALGESTTATGTSLMFVREGATGDLIKKITKDNMLKEYAKIASPTFTGTVTGTFSGNLTGNVSGSAGTVTGFTPASGSLTLSGADAITLTSIATTDVTLPTSGTLATTQNINDSLTANGIPYTDLVVAITDTIPKFVFGAGAGEAGDTVLFAKGKSCYGSFPVVNDSLYVVNLQLLKLSAGDSLKFNVYYGTRMTNTATDSLFTAPQACGVNQTTFTPNNERTIPPGVSVWIELKSNQILANTPNWWEICLNSQIIRD